MTKLFPLLALTLAFPGTCILSAQSLIVDKTSLTFFAQVNGTPTSQALNVSSTPTSAIILATPVEQSAPGIAWLGVSPTGGQTPAALTVTVDPGKLLTGTYSGSIVVSVFGGSGAGTVTVPVSVTVSSINVNPTSVSFQTSIGNTPLVQAVTLTAGQQIPFLVSATTTSGGNWLEVSPSSGSVSGGNPTAIIAIPDPTLVPLLSPGTYRGTITVTPTSGTSVAPIVVPVSLTVLPAPPVTVSPASVNINYQIGGTANTPQKTVTLSTTNAQGVAFTLSTTTQTPASGGVWVSASSVSSLVTASGTPVTIAYNTVLNLPAGAYQSTVTVSTPNGSPTKTDIPVTLVVSTLPLLNVPNDTLAFASELGASNPVPASVNITSTSGTTQAFGVAVSTTDGANWLLAPTTGSTAAPLSVSVNPLGLAPGNYTGAVTVTGVKTGNGAQQIPVTLKIYNDPAIVTDLTALALPYQIGQSKSPSQAITVTSSNGVPLNYSSIANTTTCGTGWLALSGALGSTTGQIAVNVNPQGLAAGICRGTVTIAANNALTGDPAINSPVTIPVTLTVDAGALLVVSPLTPARFSTLVGGSGQGPLIYTLTSSGADNLNYSVSASTTSGSGAWLLISQTNGQTSAGLNTLGISVQPGQLAVGTYTGAVTITATGPGGVAANSPLTIPVVFNVINGTLALGQTALSFKQSVGGAPPANQVVTVGSTFKPLNFAASAYTGASVNWLTVTPAGATPGSISVGVDGSKLAQGTYTGTVVVLATTPNAGNSPAFLTVTLAVNAGTISASPSNFGFSEVQGGPPPAAQSLTLSGAPGAISYQAMANTGDGSLWLSTSPTGGLTPGALQVIVSNNNLAVGTYSGNVTIVAVGAEGSPLVIPVTLSVLAPHNLSVTPTTLTFNAKPGATASQSAQLQVFSNSGPAPFNVTNVTAPSAFFTVSPSSGTAPAQVTVTVNPTGLAAGAYSGSFNIGSPNSISTVLITVNLVVGAAPIPLLSAIENAASYSTGPVAPGENVVIYGSGIGPATLSKGTVTNGIVDTSVAATRILFDGIAAPMIYAFTTQTSVIVPYELTGRTITNVVVEYQGVQSSPVAYTLTLAAPGIYSQNAQGSGPGAILNQDYSINLPTAPAPKGSVVAVYMSGEGFTVGAVDGAIATGLLTPVLPITATVGGLPATVVYAGTAPGIVTGAMQVNLLIPPAAPSGPSVPIVITVGSGNAAVSTQAGVTVSVQ